MKNKKMTWVAGAGAGVLALGMMGGGTYALWSDFDRIDGNNLAAGTLTLDVTDPNSSVVTPITMGELAPGENKAQEVFVAARGSGTPALQNARLTLNFENFTDTEDGCTSNSEAVLESSDPAARAGDPVCGTEGEFGDQAGIQFAYKKVNSAGACPGGGYTTSVANQGALDSVVTRTLQLGSLNPGEGMCIRVEGGLPNAGGATSEGGIDFGGLPDANNASQGDSSSFDMVFTLSQVIPN